MSGEVFFISGIDTDVGKTFATGFLAKKMAKNGKTVITQKMVQTGCKLISDDIKMHRKIQGIELTQDDLAGITCPYLFQYPASPHFAAKLENREIDLEKIAKNTKILQKKYDVVLLEGAGGLMVPMTEDFLILDYLIKHKMPVIIVTSGKLGSINHTLLSLAVCRENGLKVEKLVYNLFPKKDELITKNTLEFLQTYLIKNFPETEFIILPEIQL